MTGRTRLSNKLKKNNFENLDLIFRVAGHIWVFFIHLCEVVGRGNWTQLEVDENLNYLI